MKKVLGIFALAVSLLLTSGMASADTVTHVDWSSPNPDIHVAGMDIPSGHGNMDVSASVSGSGDFASGTTEITGRDVSQEAWFEGGDYTAEVSGTYKDHEKTPSGCSQYFHTSHKFEVEGSDDASVHQDIDSGDWKFDGYQGFTVTGADSVTASGWAQRELYTWGNQKEIDTPQSVHYVGEAQGDVGGSQRSHTSDPQEHQSGLGFGAGISGTTGTTDFDFTASTPSDYFTDDPIRPGEDALHTAVIGSVGESHTWTEDDSLDANYDWIE